MTPDGLGADPAPARTPPQPGSSEYPQDPGYGSDVGSLGQAIVHRLFSAGLDLSFAVMVTADGPVADRLQHAIAELDQAIAEVRHLMFALSRSADGPRLDGGPS